MATLDKTKEEWKLEGNTYCKNKNFFKAILCYDEALRLATSSADVQILLLNRCHARIHSQHFDAALKDAEAVLDVLPTNEKALFRMAKAYYGLRHFKKSADQLVKVVKTYPENQEAKRDLERSLARMREEKGKLDFASMLDEAIEKNPKPDMDRADYVGPIEVRTSTLDSGGQGIFSTQPIKAGELLLVEKAFSAQFPEKVISSGKYDAANTSSDELLLRARHANLTADIFLKLHCNPSLIPTFANLYPGPNAPRDFGDGKTDPAIDDDFVLSRAQYNAFEFYVLSANWQWRAKNGSSPPDTPRGVGSSAGIGVWIMASMINHSCYPTVRRSFIGDMMIWRAEANCPADTELCIGYCSSYGEPDDRQRSLGKYGFVCRCNLCHSQRNTPSENLKEREAKVGEFFKYFQNPTPTSLTAYLKIFEEVRNTYSFPPTHDPHIPLIVPLTTLISACKRTNQPKPFLGLSIAFLQSLGFEIDFSLKHWKIGEWGFLADEVIPVLQALWEVSLQVYPALSKGLLNDLKTAWAIVAGEAESIHGYLELERLSELEGKLREKTHLIEQLQETLRTNEERATQAELQQSLKEQELEELEARLAESLNVNEEKTADEPSLSKS